MRNARAIASATVLTIAAVGQIILAFVLYNEHGNSLIRNTGWAVLCISAIFGWLPIYTFRKWGQTQGRSYVHTTVLVDRGVYAVVRHPQYLAGMLMGLALALIAQHWIVALLGLVVAAILYADTYTEERAVMEKFGQEYERYSESVPRVNFIAGLARLLRRRREER